MNRSPRPDVSALHTGVDLDEPRLEVWGGVEPTVNRVGDIYLDQLTRSGHATRFDDLDLFADLGIKAIRYPVLWEKIAPGHLDDADWSWPDTRLTRLRELNVRPIVGLIHHGSGPRHTSLVDPEFPEQFADYAGAVARRYPWVESYTPVNEPLTTARFSALYGHWYPHERNDRSFARALMVQCRAVALSMRKIREVNSTARLVQTEELGRIHSTLALAYQAEYENERRWLTFDLLSGNLTSDRPLWAWLLRSGISQGELEWFLDNPCPPDMLGVNYYLSSERYLDERVEIYPGEPIGSNHIDSYVDVCAARVLREPITGIEALLKEAWSRYGLPIAITEVHNGSTREEQLRWLYEVWNHATRARGDGVDVRAITVWALLGSYDWATLVTQDNGLYEPGAFDLRDSYPRPTALAHMTRDLATRGQHDHPVLNVPGWWRRSDRFGSYTQQALEAGLDVTHRLADTRHEAPRRVLIVDGDASLAAVFSATCSERHIPAVVIDASDAGDIGRIVDQGDIWAVILAAQDCFGATSPAGPNEVATLCVTQDIRFACFSSASGAADTKEQYMAVCSNGLVVLTEPLVAPKVARDTDASSSHTRDLANVAIDLLIDGERGIWHLHRSGEASRNAGPLLHLGEQSRSKAADD